MKSLTHNMQKSVYRLFLATILVAGILVAPLSGKAQGSTNGFEFNLLHQPCNNDGILVLHDTVSTHTFPIIIQYFYGSTYVTDTSYDGYDTILNYNGSSLNVYASDVMQHYAYGYYAGALPFNYTVATTNAICPTPGTATLTITGGTPPFTYQWSDDQGNVVSTTNPATFPISLNTYTYYNVLITDAAGCVVNTADLDSIQQPIYIQTQSPVVLTTSSTDAGCTNGTATVVATGGTGPYSYVWSTGANASTITNLHLGYYSVTVVDVDGCGKINGVNVRQTVQINAQSTPTNPTCLQNDGSIIAFGSGGTPPYTYLWSNGQTTQTLTNVTAGSYSVTITDANQCIGASSRYLTASTPITTTYTSTPSNCTSATGSATLAPLGGTAPYTYHWSSFPAQTGVTATNLAPGGYSFSITDAVGCVRTGTVNIPPISTITASTSTTNAVCTQANGAAHVSATSTALPVSYLWSTGATTANITGLTSGGYACTVTDANGCKVTKSAIVDAYSPVNIGLINSQASCIFNHDGTATAAAYGGTAPYTYSWTGGQTTSTATGLETGHYYVFVTDAAGCTRSAHTFVGYDPTNDSCYCTITGTVFVDTNANCTLDTGEVGVQNIMVHCSGAGYVFTDANGRYAFRVPSGTYTLSEDVEAYYPLASCQSNAISVTTSAASGCTSTHDFANIINPLHDISIANTSLTPPVVGYNYRQRVIVKNAGTLDEAAIQMGYKMDGQLLLNTVTPSILTQQDPSGQPNWYSVTSGFPTLSPQGSQVFEFNYNVPANVPLGTLLEYRDTATYQAPISSWLTDYTPWNNVGILNATTVGSYDPNNKEVSPIGTTSHGYISTDDSVLTYTIHFQNTGTYQAYKVVVVDTLDSDLDLMSIQPGYSNYNYTATMSESGVLTFTFDNINLPPNSSDPNGSMGLVMYTIHQKPGLANGTEMTSPASIYFDYNAPVVTNAALNTIGPDTGVGIPNVTPVDLDFMVYPNPTNSQLTLAINSQIADPNATVRIYNMLGGVMQTKTTNLQPGYNAVSANVESLSSGIYFVEVAAGNQRKMQKFSVVK